MQSPPCIQYFPKILGGIYNVTVSLVCGHTLLLYYDMRKGATFIYKKLAIKQLLFDCRECF